ncbi:ThuA domain-containing protein [Galbibacter sp. EGI 63066]|uniref:ThuA domain-containing protein n=1 Tax=Galbibacter sp. EGI 63066 TaxID=2993559 RepID=UPI002248FA32|nr:ThuA domain-containing protein [Galbibacter sp. EGI 63066]MCX2681261.1 ThuA domain-containing protein [Galbibacter sp. EGI 63066]
MKYFLITTILCVTIGCGQTPKKETTTDEIVTDVHEENVLVFSKTKVYRHKSIETGVDLIKKLGKENEFGVAHTEDVSLFTLEKLSEYDVVLFLSTTGDVLNEEQQKAFEGYIQSGGGFMGIHAASDTEYEWPWYGKLVGGYFVDHPNNPNVRNADIKVLDNNHISTKHLPETWNRDDEWYNFKNLNPDVNVLLNLDETSYEGGTNGEHHPIAWYHEFDGGRAFYTGGGHTKESYAEPLFVQHVLGGIFYCLGR